MSSTNRGYDRHVADYYVTPLKPIEEFLSAFLTEEKLDRPDRMFWLDPCAGGDEHNPMSYPTVLEKVTENIATLDIREDSRAEVKADYLSKDFSKEKFDVIITNPPFALAKQIIEKALKDVIPGGYVIMLLRLNYFGSADRKKFFEENMPKYCFIHHKRISFITEHMKQQRKLAGLPNLSSDSIEYAHFVWQKGYTENFTKTFLL